jgi:hypothetical protein
MKLQKLVVGLLLSALAAFAAAQPEDVSLRKEMEGFYAKTERLIESNSPQAWSLFHPGYVMVDTQGKRSNLGQFKQMVQSMMSTSKMVNMQFNVKHVRRGINEAYVWLEEVAIFKQKVNGKWEEMKMTNRWAETLVKSGNSWKFMYSQQLPTDEPWPFKVG